MVEKWSDLELEHYANVGININDLLLREDEHTFTKFDISPVAKGHSLIMPNNA